VASAEDGIVLVGLLAAGIYLSRRENLSVPASVVGGISRPPLGPFAKEQSPMLAGGAAPHLEQDNRAPSDMVSQQEWFFAQQAYAMPVEQQGALRRGLSAGMPMPEEFAPFAYLFPPPAAKPPVGRGPGR